MRMIPILSVLLALPTSAIAAHQRPGPDSFARASAFAVVAQNKSGIIVQGGRKTREGIIVQGGREERRGIIVQGGRKDRRGIIVQGGREERRGIIVQGGRTDGGIIVQGGRKTKKKKE